MNRRSQRSYVVICTNILMLIVVGIALAIRKVPFSTFFPLAALATINSSLDICFSRKKISTVSISRQLMPVLIILVLLVIGNIVDLSLNKAFLMPVTFAFYSAHQSIQILHKANKHFHLPLPQKIKTFLDQFCEEHDSGDDGTNNRMLLV